MITRKSFECRKGFSDCTFRSCSADNRQCKCRSADFHKVTGICNNIMISEVSEYRMIRFLEKKYETGNNGRELVSIRIIDRTGLQEINMKDVSSAEIIHFDGTKEKLK